MQPRRIERAGDERAVGRTDLGDAGDMQQRPGGFDLELAPQLIGAAHQRHIGRMLEIGEADDAGLAMRRAAIVVRRETIEPEHALTAAGQMIERGASHDAEPAHHDVV